MFTEQNLTCADCGVEFAFTVSEQEFYAEKGFNNPPRRCKTCRAAAKANRGEGRGAREMFEVTCSSCGVQTQVPFKPSGSRPVFCHDCFQKEAR
ncbi:MAG TPA: zinc-binding protein [Cyanobacteria bacterium UBA8530]|nr:zinc-binding protein [Cyanobacteria bacterium UBA8530]